MNTKQSFTPGPWEAGQYGNSIIVTAKDRQYDVAVVRNIGREDNAANARLIAAAPELLEEHQRWAGWLGEALVLVLQGDYSHVNELASTFRIGFESGSAVIKSDAIAKAIGSAS